jgi:hypothetical protein
MDRGGLQGRPGAGPRARESEGRVKYATHAACLLAGFLLAWWIWRPVSPIETAAPAMTLPSGAVVAERAPDAPLPPVAREAARELGGQTARAGHVVVQPTGKESLPVDGVCLCKPDPVRVDWSLTSTKTGQRMAFFSPDGAIVEAADIPVTSVRHANKPWAAGVSVSLDMSQRRAYGAFVDRDIGRLRVGLEISQRDGGTATLRAGWRF